VKAVYAKTKEHGKALENEWNALFEKYKAQYPDLVCI
jgi:hypothetical protein